MKRRIDMMKKIILFLSVLVITALPMYVEAEDDVESTAHIIIRPGNIEIPVGPIEPSEPGGETGNVGNLTIDNVTPLNFGTNKIVPVGTYYSLDSSVKNPNVQVTDRRGLGTGWRLEVKLSEFKENDKILKGATLLLPAGKMKSTEFNISTLPNSYAVNLIPGNDSVILMSASEHTGMGTWANMFETDEISLYVPPGNMIGEYEASLTWVLSDTPSS